MRTRGGGVQNPDNFADVIYGCPLVRMIHRTPCFAAGKIIPKKLKMPLYLITTRLLTVVVINPVLHSLLVVQRRPLLLLPDQVTDEVPDQRLHVHPGDRRERLRRLDDAGQHVPRVRVHGDGQAGEGRHGVEEGRPVDPSAPLEGPVEEVVQRGGLRAVAARLLGSSSAGGPWDFIVVARSDLPRRSN